MYTFHIIVLTCVIVTYQQCLEPQNQQGNCIDCDAKSQNIDGYCYQRMRGCLVMGVGPVCLECQFGYVKVDKGCIRQAELNKNNSDNSPAPIRPDNPKNLTQPQLKNKLAQKYGPYFPTYHTHFTQKYPFLKQSQILKVTSLATRKGPLYTAHYSSTQYIYETSALINTKQQQQQQVVVELLFNKKQNNQSKGRDPITAIENIYDFTGKRLQGYQVYQVRLVDGKYYIDFVKDDNDDNVVRFKRTTLLPDALLLDDPLQLAVSISLANITIIDLAVQNTLQKHPALKNQKLTTSSQFSKHFIILTFTSSLPQQQQTTVSIQILYPTPSFTINNPYQKPLTSPTSSISTTFTGYTDLVDPRYLASLQFITSQFPQLAFAQLLDIKSQFVDGINYLFTMYVPRTDDKYVIKVFYGYKGTLMLLEAYRNGKEIYVYLYDYNDDQLFLGSYPEVVRGLLEDEGVVSVPGIVIVSRKISVSQQQQQIITYQVNYNLNQYLKYSLSPITNTPQLLQYILDTNNNLINNPNHLPRSSQQLITYLNQQKPITKSGTYIAIIQDFGVIVGEQQREQRGGLNLVQYTQFSTASCYQLKLGVDMDGKIRKIDGYLRDLYPIIGFGMQLFQVKVQPDNIREYRILYSNQKLQQIQFFIRSQPQQQQQQQQQKLTNQLTITKAQILNTGYQLQQPLSTNIQYNIAIQSISKQQNNKTYIPFLTQSNSNNIQTYYHNDKSTIKLIIDRSTNNRKVEIVQTRTYIVKPVTFQFSKMIVPKVQGVTHEEGVQAILKNIVMDVSALYSYYIRNPVIKYAQAQKRQHPNTYFYTIMLQTDRGYIRVAIQVKDIKNYQTNSSRILSLVITSYKQSDFSTCRHYSVEGRCLSCEEGMFIYQDSCFRKIQGCLIQPGGSCVKCDVNYVQRGYQCFKDCAVMF